MLIPIIRRERFFLEQSPLEPVEIWEKDVAVDLGVNLSPIQTISSGQRQLIDLPTSDHEDLVIIAGGPESLRQTRGNLVPDGLIIWITCDHDPMPSRQWTAYRFVSPSTHQDVVAQRAFLESAKIPRQVPRQLPTPTDDTVFRYRHNQRDDHRC